MLKPEVLLGHAQRLLAAAVDEADLRRTVSAAYYVVFDHLIIEAAATQAGASTPVQDRIRRSIEHGDVRKVCMALAARHGSRPALLQELLVGPVIPGLVFVAETFVVLHDGRLAADYDLNRSVPFAVAASDASLALTLAQTVLDIWPALRLDPNTGTFLAALLFYNRWTRRP